MFYTDLKIALRANAVKARLNIVTSSMSIEVSKAAAPPRQDEGVGWALDELQALRELVRGNVAVRTLANEGHIESLVPSTHTLAAVVEGGRHHRHSPAQYFPYDLE
jgi:hypothetical protein